MDLVAHCYKVKGPICYKTNLKDLYVTNVKLKGPMV